MTAPHEQKLKVTGPVVITANRTGDGVVVYWARAGGWTRELHGAAVVTSAPEASALMAAAVADDLHAIGPYVAPVAVGPDGRALPGNLRERIRLAGPTIPWPGQAVA